MLVTVAHGLPMVCPWTRTVRVMTGSLRRRGRDSWELRVYLGRGPDGTKERWATRTVHGSRRYATEQLGALVEEASATRVHAGTFADLLHRWFDTASPSWSASTVRETRSLIRCHLAPHLGHVAVARLTTEDIDDFYADLLRHGGPDGRPLASGTVHRIHVVVHRALAQALRWGWIWINPAASASPPRIEPGDIRPPTIVQVQRLLDIVRADDIDFYAFVHLAVVTGARRSQLLALRWSDIDFDHAALGFTRALIEGPSGPVLRPTTNRRTYRIALDQTSLELLAAHQKRAASRWHRADLSPGHFVFTDDPSGLRPWLPNRVTKRFIVYRRQAGLDGVRLHDLRHFMATTMLAAGVPVPVVSERLCHARTSTTVNVYAHAMPGADRDAANLLP
jgi:integrase